MNKLSSPNIMKPLFFYIFGVLYLQVMELILPFSVTKIVFLVLLMIVAINILKKRYKADLFFYLIVLAGIIYLYIYLSTFNELISYVYPPVIVAAISALALDNSPKNAAYINWRNINKLILIYLFVNIVFFLLKFDICFQDAGIQQFRGFLPHTNMLGAVLVSLYLIVFWQKGIVAAIDRILILLLILGTYSRTYIALIAMIISLQLIGLYQRKIPFIGKLLIGIILLLIVGFPLFNLLVVFIPALARFRMHGFSANGRQYLSEAFLNTMKESSFKDLLLGVNLPEAYFSNIKLDFPHSFTENSYMGITLMFGIVGLSIFLIILCRIFRQVRSAQTACVIIVCMIPLLMQDILLSVQTGILYVFSILCVIYQDPKRLKDLNPLQQL